MASVFDHARALARALRECEEAQAMKRLGARVARDAALEKVLGEFRLRQFEVQVAAAQGQEPSRQLVARLEQLGRQVEADKTLSEYLTAENAYGQLLVEVQNVLDEAFNPSVPGQVKAK